MWVEKYKDKKQWCKSERIKKKGGKKRENRKGIDKFLFLFNKTKK